MNNQIKCDKNYLHKLIRIVSRETKHRRKNEHKKHDHHIRHIDYHCHCRRRIIMESTSSSNGITLGYQQSGKRLHAQILGSVPHAAHHIWNVDSVPGRSGHGSTQGKHCAIPREFQPLHRTDHHLHALHPRADIGMESRIYKLQDEHSNAAIHGRTIYSHRLHIEKGEAQLLHWHPYPVDFIQRQRLGQNTSTRLSLVHGVRRTGSHRRFLRRHGCVLDDVHSADWIEFIARDLFVCIVSRRNQSITVSRETVKKRKKTASVVASVKSSQQVSANVESNKND